jgi:predicted helicase
MRSFSDIYILNLHGNARSRHRPPGGGIDQNVFDIQQGVAIALFVKDPDHDGPPRVFHADLWGPRPTKYEWLQGHDYTTTEWEEIEPRSRFYLFKPQNLELADEYERGWRLTDAMPLSVTGFQTHRDEFAVAFDRETLVERLDDLRDAGQTDQDLREKYDLTDNRDWELASARATIQGDPQWEDAIVQCLYRPFDKRWCYFSYVAMDYPRRELLRHVVGRGNPCLGVGPAGNAVDDPEWSLVFSALEPADANVFRRGGMTVFPVHVYDGAAVGEQIGMESQGRGDDEPRANMADEFVAEFAGATGLTFQDSGAGDLVGTFGPENVFHYIYAILHSQDYRVRYADFLDVDFPRIPIPTDRELFISVAEKGGRLFEFHQLQADSLASAIATYPIAGSDRVDAIARFTPEDDPAVLGAEPDPGVSPALGRVYINDTQYFARVPEDVWEFRIGGYQVCEKWLKDRRRRTITSEVPTFLRIVAALRQTIDVMEEIDDELDEWPWEVTSD